MREKLADVTADARAFVYSSNPNDQIFVENFNETVSLGLPIGMRFSDGTCLRTAGGSRQSVISTWTKSGAVPPP